MLKIKRGLWGVLVLCSFSATAQQLRSVDAPPEEVKIPVEPYALEQRYRTLAAMPSVQVRYSDLGLIDQIKGNTGIAVSRRATSLQPGDAATELLAPLKDVLLATGDEALTVTANQFIEPNTRTITTEQTVRGIPVLFGLVAFGIEESTGRVNGVTAYFLPDRGLPRKAVISADEAIQSAVEALESSGRAEPHSVNVSRSPTLAYHGAVRGATSTALVWVVRASFLPLEEGPPETEEMWIDATDGTYLGGHNPSQSALNRTVYSAGNVSLNRDAYPTGLGNPLFTEGGSSSDSTAMNAYNNAGKTNAAWNARFNSELSRPIRIVVHYGLKVSNAWHNKISNIDNRKRRAHFCDASIIVGFRFLPLVMTAASAFANASAADDFVDLPVAPPQAEA